jgi:hypothetical protein
MKAALAASRNTTRSESDESMKSRPRSTRLRVSARVEADCVRRHGTSDSPIATIKSSDAAASSSRSSNGHTRAFHGSMHSCHSRGRASSSSACIAMSSRNPRSKKMQSVEVSSAGVSISTLYSPSLRSRCIRSVRTKLRPCADHVARPAVTALSDTVSAGPLALYERPRPRRTLVPGHVSEDGRSMTAVASRRMSVPQRQYCITIHTMARGWESKSVESQQNEDLGHGARSRESAEEIERKQKRESLELSRVRVSRELEAARSPVHRAALENALQFLNDELKKV